MTRMGLTISYLQHTARVLAFFHRELTMPGASCSYDSALTSAPAQETQEILFYMIVHERQRQKHLKSAPYLLLSQLHFSAGTV